MLRALDKRYADDVSDAVRILRTYISEVFAARFEGDFRVSGDRLDAYVTKCAAWEGARRAALERADQACIACEELWIAWLKTLLTNWRVQFDIHWRIGYGDPRPHLVLEFERMFGE